MDEQMAQQLTATAERLASVAETLDRVLEKLDAQQEAMNAKVDRIVAAVEDRTEVIAEGGTPRELRERLAELEKANSQLKAQAARMTRKTLSPLASSLLAKDNNEGDKVDAAVLDKTLQALSVEQRIAVKAEMARAGMIE
jgi:ABC-type transporter Mla subunit MlaD